MSDSGRPRRNSNGRLASLAAILPTTFYADRPIAERLQFMVDGWRKAVEANQVLEQRLAEVEAANAEVFCQLQIRDRDGYWVSLSDEVSDREPAEWFDAAKVYYAETDMRIVRVVRSVLHERAALAKEKPTQKT